MSGESWRDWTVTPSVGGDIPLPDDHDPEESTVPSSPSPLNVAVVICAYSENRWDQTLDAIRSVIIQDDSPDEILLVVDHIGPRSTTPDGRSS